MTTLPEVITGGTTTGHDGHHQALHARYNQGIGDTLVSPVVGQNNTTMIADAIAETPVGGTLRFRDPGVFRCEALPAITKVIRIVGAGGGWNTCLKPSTDTASPILSFNSGGGGTVVSDYGPSVERLAIDLSSAPSATGLRTSPTTQWFDASRMTILNGFRSIDHHGPNATFEDMVLLDASDTFFNADKDGLELHLQQIRIASNTRAVAAYMRIDFTGGTGAVYLDDVTCNANLAGGFGPGEGIRWTATALVEPFIFADRLIIDNVTGGGPCLTLTNLQSTTIQNSYMNGTNGCVKLDGCHNPHFDNVRYRGGTPGTYIFGTTAVTDGFVSVNCEIPSTPAYKVGASNKPTNFYADDRIVGATSPGQVTNDVDWLTHAGSLLWGPRYFRDRVGLENTPPVIGNQLSGVATLGSAGKVTVACPATSVALSRWTLTRQTVNGTPGHLYISAKSDGVNFEISSSDTSERSTIYWLMSY